MEQFPWFSCVIYHHCLSSLLVLTSIIYHNAHFPSYPSFLSDMWNLLLLNWRAGGNMSPSYIIVLSELRAFSVGSGRLEKAILSWIKTVLLAPGKFFQLSLKVLHFVFCCLCWTSHGLFEPPFPYALPRPALPIPIFAFSLWHLPLPFFWNSLSLVWLSGELLLIFKDPAPMLPPPVAFPANARLTPGGTEDSHFCAAMITWT